MPEKESKGGVTKKDKLWVSNSKALTDKQITPKKMLKHEKGEDTHIQKILKNWMKS